MLQTVNGYVFNPTFSPVGQSGNNNPTVSADPGAGFAGIDQSYTFSTGSITINDQGTARTGTIFINATSFNVGGEFLSLNFIQVEENDVTGAVTLSIDFNAFGDFQDGGNESVFVTTNFGVANDIAGDDIVPVVGGDSAVAEVFTLQLVEGIPEPSSTALLGLGGLALLMHRRRA